MNISNQKTCTCCGACINICPTHAISTEKNGLFYRMVVDESQCIQCGQCLFHCPLHVEKSDHRPIAAFAVQNKDVSIRKNSSSGGAFSALAEFVLKQGGVVFGAAYRDDFNEVMLASTDQVKLEQLRRSKYVESLTGESFSKLKEELEKGRKVLFCGTPCQAAGLRSFLGKDYDNLIVCDFSCGGMPSHKLFQEYLDSFRAKGKAIKSVNFRSKKCGWSQYHMCIEFKTGKPYFKYFALDPYFAAFLRGKYSVRDNCLQCEFAEEHASDLTFADFWKWREFTGIKEDETGISLVVSNTQRGNQLLLNPDLEIQKTELPLQKAVYNYRKPQYSAENMEKREIFWNDYAKTGLFASSKKNCMYHGIKKLKTIVKEYYRKLT